MPAFASDRPSANLVLMGLRGCGKTSVGRLVAHQLAWEFIDTDDLIERKETRTIAAIFAADGEAAFRELERQAVRQAVRGTRMVIAVGGGAVLVEANRQALRAAGLCLWLTAPAEELHRRLQADPRSPTRRPALTSLPGLAEMEEMLATRRPFYEALADHVVDTTGRTVAEVAREVVALLPSGIRPAKGS